MTDTGVALVVFVVLSLDNSTCESDAYIDFDAYSTLHALKQRARYYF